MLMHGVRGSMVCELLPTKLTTNFKRSLLFTAIYIVQTFQSSSSKTAFFLELALLPLAELSYSAAILLKLWTQGKLHMRSD